MQITQANKSNHFKAARVLSKTKKWSLSAACCLIFFLLAGCGSQVTFEKLDHKGHVRVEKDGQGYCYKVPTDWEIREALEEADVVCLAPLSEGFRDSIVSTTLSSYDLANPEQTIASQLETLGPSLTVVEAWSQSDKPLVLTLESSELSRLPLAQFLFIHQRPEGGGVLITCTTKKDRLQERREFFENIAAATKYDLAECSGPGGLPETYPTPEVTLSPSAK